jgi:hypothetical protein
MAHMVKRCVNSSCREEFKLLNGGDLYALERRSVNTEFFWLCSACARVHELYLDPMGYVSVRDGGLIHRMPPPHPDANLRLISRMMRPRPDTMPSGERESTFMPINEPFFRGFPYAKRRRALNCARGALLAKIDFPAETDEGGQNGKPVSFRSEDAK